MYEKYEVINSKNFEKRLELEDKLILLLYGLYLVLKPFYFWSSGVPQVSDFIMVLMISLFISIKHNYKIILKNTNLMMIMLVFTFFSIGVNLVWSILLSSTDMIAPSIYLFYNCLIFIIISIMTQLYRSEMIKATYYFAVISITTQFCLFIIQGGFSGVRNTTAFNNPNQLGYYSLLVASIIIFCSNRLNFFTKTTLISLFLGLILAFSSLSKAAILSYIGVLLTYIVSKLISRKYTKKILLIIFTIVGIYFFIDLTTNFFEENQLFRAVEVRIENIGQDSDDNIQGRGYDRIADYPEYWLFGAGEGEYQRFPGPLQGNELHSTLGNIQISYGLIGLISFLLVIYYALKPNHYRFLYIIFFLLLYGLTHNGLRNSLFWILIAMIGSSDHKSLNMN